jgi:hypothetical protein
MGAVAFRSAAPGLISRRVKVTVPASATLHKRGVLTHIALAVIGRVARGLVVADRPDAVRSGVFELNTAAMRSKGLGGRKGRLDIFAHFALQ